MGAMSHGCTYSTAGTTLRVVPLSDHTFPEYFFCSFSQFPHVKFPHFTLNLSHDSSFPLPFKAISRYFKAISRYFRITGL
jgi:hypothetical protein